MFQTTTAKFKNAAPGLARRAAKNPSIRTAATLALLGGTTKSMYDAYRDALKNGELSPRQMQNSDTRVKSAAISDSVASAAKSLKDAFLSRYPEFSEPFIEYSYGDGNGASIEFHGPHNVAGDYIDAIKTIKDDPGNHKKKALAALVPFGLGVALTSRSMTNALRQARDELATPKSDPTGDSAMLNATMAAIPLSLYYIYRNHDRPSRLGAGGAALGLATAKAEEYARESKVAETGLSTLTPQQKRDAWGMNIGVGTATLSAIYASHHLQAAADEAKLRALGASGMSLKEKAREINRIRAKRDFLSRYPAFRPTPYSETLRGWYNKLHPPKPEVSKADYNKYIKPGL